ncbi:MAG: hypothetical protein JRL30_14145 [Deltaproteobacteria bacterium]|nr:hypothetical protein [Deltaproteobacteria bacterium]
MKNLQRGISQKIAGYLLVCLFILAFAGSTPIFADDVSDVASVKIVGLTDGATYCGSIPVSIMGVVHSNPTGKLYSVDWKLDSDPIHEYDLDPNTLNYFTPIKAIFGPFINDFLTIGVHTFEVLLFDDANQLVATEKITYEVADCVQDGETDVLTLAPQLSQAPENPPWRTFGDLGFSNGVMTIRNGATDDYSAEEQFVFAGLFLNMSDTMNVTEFTADVMMPSSSEYGNDLTGATLAINITRQLTNGDNIQMRLELNEGHGTPFIVPNVFNHSSDGSVTLPETGPRQPAGLDTFYNLKIAFHDKWVSFSVDGTVIYVWEFGFDEWARTDAYVWGFNYFDVVPGRDIEGQVRNVQVKFEPMGTPSFNFDIPTRSISVDGQGDDWEGISPIIEDVEDSTCGEGSDLKSVYLARDERYLYWRIDTWSGTFQFDEGEFGRGPGILFYEASSPVGIEHSIIGGPDNWSISKRYSPDGNWVNLLNSYTNLNSGTYGAIGGVAEGMIPIGLFSDLDIGFISAWYHQGDENILCDEASLTSSISKINFALLYSDNRRYDPRRFDALPESHPGVNGNEYWFMQALAFTSGDETAPVYLDTVSGTLGPIQLENWGYWPDLGNFNVTNFIGESNGGAFSDPGSGAWDNETYTFSVGNQKWYWPIPEGSLKKLSIPTATITGSTNPTIEWDRVEGADYYRISIYPLILVNPSSTESYYYPDWQNPALFDSDKIYGTSYTYGGDIFKDGGTYAIFIQARQNHPDMGSLWINRSTYITTHSAMSTFCIDIKPGTCDNPLNVKSKGVLPVAILGTEDFDVTSINIDTIQLNGIAPLRYELEDVSAASSDENCDGLYPDGILDLTLKFSTQDIVAALGAVADGNEVTLTLTGELNDGITIEGSDTVLILKKDKKGK